MSTHNPFVAYDASYVGLYYALLGVGGFAMEEGFQTITMVPINPLNQYDVTESVQVMFDVRYFNEALGLYKDATNTHILSSSFDQNTLKFPIDTITLQAADFVSRMIAEYVISVGKLQFIYMDFMMYVNDYFSYANGFSTLFTLEDANNFNNGVFDASAFIHLINGKTLNPDTGEYVADLSGSITISDVNNILNYLVYADPFNNRPKSGNNGAGYTEQDGFLEGDLIFIPTGITVTLTVDVTTNGIILNTLGVEHCHQLTNVYDYNIGYFSSITTNTQTNITRIIKAPLLIKLMNLSSL